MCVHVSFYLFQLLGVVMRSRQTIQTITQALNIRSFVRMIGGQTFVEFHMEYEMCPW